MDNQELKILSSIQESIPIIRNPYKAISEELGIPEEKLIRRICHLRGRGIIRYIGPILNHRSLGYKSTLIALEAPPKNIDNVAQRINGHPGVSHNYLRDHRLNIWFTLSLREKMDFLDELDNILHNTSVTESLNLPVVKEYKIRFSLPLRESPSTMSYTKTGLKSKKVHLTEFQRSLIIAVQRDLGVESRPFLGIADDLGAGEDEVLACIKDLISNGCIRRFSAMVNHTNAGFPSNAMVAWRVPSSRVDSAGRDLSSEDLISHCYQRATCPDWPYNLYTMIHGRDNDEILRLIKGISQTKGIKDYASLFTLKELKKVRIRYLVDI